MLHLRSLYSIRHLFRKLTIRRIIAKTLVSDEPSLLEQLGSAYRNFKQQNPQRTARVPLEIKTRAREVLAGGSTIDEIAKAAGISRTAVNLWINKLDAQSERAERRKSKAPKSQEPVVKSEAVPSESKNEQDWVRIRIDGREIEVEKKDFWSLLQGK